jgi:hypothetical protein
MCHCVYTGIEYVNESGSSTYIYDEAIKRMVIGNGDHRNIQLNKIGKKRARNRIGTIIGVIVTTIYSTLYMSKSSRIFFSVTVIGITDKQ